MKERIGIKKTCVSIWLHSKRIPIKLANKETIDLSLGGKRHKTLFLPACLPACFTLSRPNSL